MLLSTLDIALRGATVALLLVLTATLLRDFRHVVAGRLAAAFALGSVAHAVTYGIDINSRLALWHVPLIALSTGDVVVFWLFTRALFDDAFVLRWRHALIWAAVTIISFVNCMWVAPSGHARLSIIAINLVSLGFIALAIGQTVSSWSVDLVERRRSVRVFIVATVALYVGLNAVLQVVATGGEMADLANTTNGVMLACIAAAISYAMTGAAAAELFPAEPRAVTAAATNPLSSRKRMPGIKNWWKR